MTKPPFRFWSFFFSLKGRVSRVGIWAFVFPAHSAITISALSIYAFQRFKTDPLATPASIMNSPTVIANMVVGLVALLLLWPMFAVTFKRLHDVNLTGIIALLYLMPFVFAAGGVIIAMTGQYEAERYIRWAKSASEGYLWLLTLVLAYLAGNRGSNRYGLDPLGRGTAPDVF